MSDDLRDFVTAACRHNGVQVPYFSGRVSVVSFVWTTLEMAARRVEGYPGHGFSRQLSRQLLSHTDATGVGLIERLAERLKPLLSRASTFRRSDERYLLSVCLLYGLHLKPRVSVGVLEILLPIYDAASFIKPADAAETFWDCARIVMFATLQCFLPDESDIRADENTDESLLEQLADRLSHSTTLSDFFRWTPDASDPMRLVLQFGYALLQMRYSRDRRDEFKARIEVCHKVGIFRALTQVLSDHIFIQNINEGDQKLCTEVVYRLMTTFFDMEYRAVYRSNHILSRNTAELLKNGVSDQRGDDFCSTLDCLAVVLEKCPDIINDPHAEHMTEFIGGIPESNLLPQSVHVMTSFIGVMKALATGDGGVDRVFHQLVASARNQFSTARDGYKYISWDFILKSFMDLSDVLIKHTGTRTLGVSSDEVAGFTAYMRLLAKLCRTGSPTRIEERLTRLDTEFNSILRNEKLRDMTLFLFCKRVPPELKAACAEALAEMGRAHGMANQILNNLRHVGLFATRNDARTVHRHYMHNQLSTIEAPIGKYDCTIWTLRMVNGLLDHAEPLTERECAMGEVTVFCRDVLLDAIWKYLRYADPAQNWELSAVVFEHFLVCLERLEKDTYPTTPQEPSPGQLVLHDTLSCGLIYIAMRTCTQRYYGHRNALQFPSNAANSAILMLIELILAVFANESRIENRPRGGYRPFREIFIGDREFMQKLLCTVDCSLPTDVQLAATELARQLFGTKPELMTVLDPDTGVSVLGGLKEIYMQGHPL